MNVRTLLIIAGLALPVVAFAILTQSTPQSSKTASVRTDISTDDEASTAQADANEPASASAQPAPAAATAASAQPQPAPATATVGPNAGLVPKDVTPGPMSVPPVLLPSIEDEQKAQQQGNDEPDPMQMTLQQAIEKTKTRLEYLEKMDPAQWPEERKRHANAPESLYKAKEFNRKRLAKLATMSQTQWEQEQKKVKMKLLRRLQQLAPEPGMAQPQPQLPALEPVQ